VLAPADKWDARTRLNIAFGAGMSTTILQLAQGYQAIANGGVSEPLRLVESCTKADGTVVTPDLPAAQQVVSGQAASTVISMMENDQAFYATGDDVQIPGYRIASKTGTAYVALNGAYTNQSTISYAAIAPADDPQYVVITSIGLPYKGNSHLVGTAVRDVLAQVLSKNHVAPSTGEMTQYPMYW
jgi:cell division protein FtsI (penicillin-binding protein 3)